MKIDHVTRSTPVASVFEVPAMEPPYLLAWFDYTEDFSTGYDIKQLLKFPQKFFYI